MTHTNGSNGPPGALVRPRFVHRQVVTAHDLNAGEDYVVERLRRHNRALHGCGVVCGLLAGVYDDGVGGRGLRLSAGVAIDGAGNEIHVPDEVVIGLEEMCWSGDGGLTRAAWPPPSHDECDGEGPGLERYYLAICHTERHDCPRPVAGQPCDGSTACDHLRLRAGYELILLSSIGDDVCARRGLPVDDPQWRYDLWGHAVGAAPAAVLAAPPDVRRRLDYVGTAWGSAGPDPALDAARFIGHGSRSLYFPAGRYRFTVTLRGGRAGVPASSPTLTNIQERGMMRVGLTGGLGDIQEDGTVGGLEGALAPRLADRLAGVGAEFLPLTAAQRGTALQTGTVDVLLVRLSAAVVPGGSSPVPYLLADDGRGMVVRSGDPAFSAQVEDALAGLVDDGEWADAHATGESGPAPHPGAALIGGVALTIDGQVVLDRARAVGDGRFSFSSLLPPGTRAVSLLHFGRADQPGGVQLTWGPVETGWHAAYYAFQGEQGPDIDALGPPVHVRMEPGIALDLANNAPPAPGVPGTHFATRWRRDVMIETAGEYEFDAITDDGMRIVVDDAIVLDTWQPQAPTRYLTRASLRAGLHRVRVDFFQRRGLSVAKVRWRRVGPYNPACEPPAPGCVALAALDLDEGRVTHVENFAIEPAAGIGRKIVPSAASADPTPADPDPRAPAIAQIVPGTAFIGADATAVVFGRGLQGARDIRFADGAITGEVLPGGTDSWVPVSISVSPTASPGPRGFTLGTPHCSVASDDFGIRFVVAEQPAAEPGGDGPPIGPFPPIGGGIFERFPDLEIAQPGASTPTVTIPPLVIDVVAETRQPVVDPGILVTSPPAVETGPIDVVRGVPGASMPTATSQPVVSVDFVGAAADAERAPVVAPAVTEAAPTRPAGAEVAPAEVASVAAEPVTAVGGIGPTRAERLAGAGITTVGELADAEVETVRTALGFSESRAARVIRDAGRTIRP